VENKQLSDSRTVIVTAPNTEARAQPTADAAAVFRAEKNVLLEVEEAPANGWLKVRHRDGESGYVKIGAVWGV
jgi:SH3-like domain-containing protein